MTTPCAECPFLRTKGAVRLRRGRIEEIAGMMLDSGGGTFPCHKTMDTPRETHCAGALIFAEKNGNATQMMRIAERINHNGTGYDPRKLNMEADVFDDLEEMLETAI